MSNKLTLNPNLLQIFHEGRKRRLFVGELIYNPKKSIFELIYDKTYAYSKTAIPIGPDLSLFQLHHESEQGKLFKSLTDRIPSRENPAYEDYCLNQGISVDEKNPIILLGTIGKKGPSSFIFELVYDNKFDSTDVKKIRDQLGITQHDLAVILGISRSTLVSVEQGKRHDLTTLNRIQVFFEFPEVALWQLKQKGSWLHSTVLTRLLHHFKKQT